MIALLVLAPLLIIALGAPGVRDNSINGASLRFECIATIQGLTLPDQPWSPAGDELLLVGPDGLHVARATDGYRNPQLILSGMLTGQAWSPDGKWVACSVKPHPESTQKSRSELLVVSPSSGKTIRALQGVSFHDYAWAPSGGLWVDHDSGRDGRIDLLRLGVAVTPSSVRRPLIPDFTRGNGLRVARITDFGKVRFDITPSPSNAGDHVVFKDAFADGRYLVDVSWPYWRTVIVDSLGVIQDEVIQGVQEGVFHGRSVSADGRFVAGFVEVDRGDTIESTTLLIRDLLLKQTLTITGAPPGLAPAFSRVSDTFTFQGLKDGIVYVGRLARN